MPEYAFLIIAFLFAGWGRGLAGFGFAVTTTLLLVNQPDVTLLVFLHLCISVELSAVAMLSEFLLRINNKAIGYENTNHHILRSMDHAMCIFTRNCFRRNVGSGLSGRTRQRAFWNQHAARFFYAPAFDFAEVTNATSYQFTVVTASGDTLRFTAGKPWASLSPVWKAIPEGMTHLFVDGLDRTGTVVGRAGERKFYRSPAFVQADIRPANTYFESASEGLQALFQAPSVQYWLQHGKPDPTYVRYCFANKVIGGLLKAMVAYSQNAETSAEWSDAKNMARKMGDYLLSIRQPPTSRYAYVPPTYIENVNGAPEPAPDRAKKNWLMVPSVVDASLGLLDLYDITRDKKYYEAAIKMAQTLLANQDADGTWPVMVNAVTGEPVHSLRMIPTAIIAFFDRLDHQYHETAYRSGRKKAWNWVVKNPLRTYQWDAQFEDVALKGPYENLSREQACDAASLLLDDAQNHPEAIAQAEELLRFAEDQFVVWSPVKDPDSWTKFVHPVRKRAPETWLSPTVLEQFICYEPVARSSAILINVYIKAHQVTKKQQYLQKASGLANGLLAGQRYIAETYGSPAEIPTWVKKIKPSNWMNNSYYASEAMMNLALYLKEVAND